MAPEQCPNCLEPAPADHRDCPLKPKVVRGLDGVISCLGKGLERLIARRLAWSSIEHEVLHDQQGGALPKRSAVDLATALLIHDIDLALDRGTVATLVTMDIQGAFDSVLRKRLIIRLGDQGWPVLLHELPFG